MFELATAWELGKFMFSSYSWAKKSLKKEADYVLPRTAQLVNAREQLVSLKGIHKEPPRIEVVRKAALAEGIAALAAQIRPGLDLNELHALPVSWDGTRSRDLRVETCDFADILAMRTQPVNEASARPPILSAGAVIVCPSENCILVHKRSPHSATYPNAIHILGGAYKPYVTHGAFDSPGDRTSLEFTMLREIYEESGIIVRRYEAKEPLCVAQELDTGFIQYVYLGVRITRNDLGLATANSEGDVIAIPFDDLTGRLGDSAQWVPTGRAQIMVWLGLGAPGAGRFARFNGRSAREAFDTIASS